jgi:glutathione S-transferase
MQLLANTTSPFARIARVALIEKGLDIEPTLVDPWAGDKRLLDANAAERVPTLVLDNGTALTESLLIVQWLEATRPAPKWPSLLGADAGQVAGVLSRAGVALGGIEASVHTIITRKVTAPALFDDTPVGMKRRRTMVDAMQKLDALADAMQAKTPAAVAPTLDVICAVVLYDYQMLRYANQAWLPAAPKLAALAQAWRVRPSFAKSMPVIV